MQAEHRPFWKVNQTEASNNRNRMKLMDKGLILHHEESNEITTLTLRVNNSSADINNTHIQCRTLTSVHSEIATILIIAGDSKYQLIIILNYYCCCIINAKHE